MDKRKSLQPVAVKPEVLKKYGRNSRRKIPVAFDNMGCLANGKNRKLSSVCKYIPSENIFIPNYQVEETMPILQSQRLPAIEIATESAKDAIMHALKPKINAVVKKFKNGEGDGMLFEDYVINEGKGNYIYKTSTQSIPFKDCFVSLDKDEFERNYSKVNEVVQSDKTIRSSGRQTKNSRKSQYYQKIEDSISIGRGKRKRSQSLVEVNINSDNNHYQTTTPRIPREQHALKNLRRRKLKIDIPKTIDIQTICLDSSPEDTVVDLTKSTPKQQPGKLSKNGVELEIIDSKGSSDDKKSCPPFPKRKITDYFTKDDSQKQNISSKKRNVRSHLKPQENNTTEISHPCPTRSPQIPENLKTILTQETPGTEDSKEDIENFFATTENNNSDLEKADEVEVKLDLILDPQVRPLKIVSLPHAQMQKALRKYSSIYNREKESLYLRSNDESTKSLRRLDSCFVASNMNIFIRVVRDQPPKKLDIIQECNPFALQQKNVPLPLFSNVSVYMNSEIENKYNEDNVRSMKEYLEQYPPSLEEVASYILNTSLGNFRERSFSRSFNQLQQILMQGKDAPHVQPKHVPMQLEDVQPKNGPIQLDQGSPQLELQSFEFTNSTNPILDPMESTILDGIFQDIISMEEDMNFETKQIYEQKLEADLLKQFYKELRMIGSLVHEYIENFDE